MYDGQIVDPSLYRVSYKNNRAIGTATAVATGVTPYAIGTISMDFDIKHTKHYMITDIDCSTPQKPGTETVYCSLCGKQKSLANIPMVSSMDLSSYSMVYDRLAKNPQVT